MDLGDGQNLKNLINFLKTQINIRGGIVSHILGDIRIHEVVKINFKVYWEFWLGLGLGLEFHVDLGDNINQIKFP